MERYDKKTNELLIEVLKNELESIEKEYKDDESGTHCESVKYGRETAIKDLIRKFENSNEKIEFESKKYYKLEKLGEQAPNSAVIQLMYQLKGIDYFRVLTTDADGNTNIWTGDLTVKYAVIEKFCAENRIYYEEFDREKRIDDFVINGGTYTEEIKKVQKITAEFI